MSILVSAATRVVVSGITGRQGMLQTRSMAAYGTRVVAGVSPGKGGSRVDGIPVFETIEQAVKNTGANASILFVPPPAAAETIMEAGDAGVELAVCITEGIPAQDMMRVKRAIRGKRLTLIGPNSPGIITPGVCKLGIMPGSIQKAGRIGVVSRSGTLTYEAVAQLTRLGIGQSTVVGIGGDAIRGLRFIDVIAMFAEDPDTDGIVMLGEIGAGGEEEAARWIRENTGKPAVAFIGGRTAPPGKRMGHAGAMISGGGGGAEEKIRAIQECGVPVADLIDKIGELMKERLIQAGAYESATAAV